MSRILVISSSVARGHVGLAASVPVLQALGHEVTALPTVLLSNHPGHARSARTAVAPDALAAMVAALADNGWLDDVDAVLSGYLPSAAHADIARDIVDRVRSARPGSLYVCDPVIGDDPGGLYVPEDSAGAIRDLLVPVADIVTPNRFELAWLAHGQVASVESAVEAARTLAPRVNLATSIPADGGLANVLVAWSDTETWAGEALPYVPHGTGDVLAALVTGLIVHGAAPIDAVGDACRLLALLVEASQGRDELALVPFLATIRPQGVGR